jgi:hypothetical protein
MNKGRVFLVIAVVVKGDDLEIAKAGWQVCDGGDPDTDAMASKTVALVLAAVVQEFFDLHG